jgi:dihydrofolate synthase/folylpolyglutamate synthase
VTGTQPAQRRQLQWLLGFSDPTLGVGWNPRASRAARWRLGRMRALLGLMDDPDRGMTVVLIAGTKGKGSTAAFVASILHSGGVRAGLFTSPHLQIFRERVRVDGAMLSDAEFERAIDRLRPIVTRLRRAHPTAGDPTTFELTLALALRAFAEHRCAVAVVEVGLGGRLDATNALDPAVSVLTPVSHDHTAILGRSLATIAAEKAGILRAGRPAVIAGQRPAADAAIRRACRAVGADCRSVPALRRIAEVALSGAHQRENAAVALCAARALATTGVAIPERAYADGLGRAVWPGRFERVPGRPAIILDSAHNDASAVALARALRAERRGRPIVLVVGINTDKDARAVLRPLARIASVIVATRSSNPRAAEPADVARTATRATRRPVDVAPDVGAALAIARTRAGADGLVCVTGSLALAGEARTALGLAPAERWWSG